LFNLIEDLLQNEKFINPIKESLKIFLRSIKEPKNKENISGFVNHKQSNNNYKLLITNFKENENVLYKSESDIIISNEISFNIFSEKDLHLSDLLKIKESLKEKDLIIYELEKLILDIMNYNKVGLIFMKKFVENC